MRFLRLFPAASLLLTLLPPAHSQNVRLTNDVSGGYTSAYTLATGNPYTDSVLTECSMSRGRQNEPSVAVDPRNTAVLIGSSNDYCGVFNTTVNGVPLATGPIWLGYYRSENGGASFQSSLVPGYPEDTSPYAALAQIRTASSGDPVIAWDGHGRVFMGSESSGDPSGSKKTFGDVWVARFDNPGGENGSTLNDGKRFVGSTIVQRGSSAPNLLGRFQDKTSIEADRTGGRCDANVYFAWASFNGNGANQIYLSRSTDHGASWLHLTKLSESLQSLQDPDIAITGNGNVYVTFRTFAFRNGEPDAVYYVKSTDCGATFSPPALVTTFLRWDAQDQTAPQGALGPSSPLEDVEFDEGAPKEARARDCGDFADHCVSGYTFFRVDSSPRSTADQYDSTHEYIYIVYGASKPGTTVSTGTTYGTIVSGTGSQSGAYFTRLNGATGDHTTPILLDAQAAGHQIWPDVSADGGVLHVFYYDSRNDSAYSPARPIGNDASRGTHPALDVFATRSSDLGATWATPTRVTDFTSNPNYEQFDTRAVPFNGDYLWITSFGNFSYGTWTDYRNTVAGLDAREGGDSDNDGADVKQCRAVDPVTGAVGPDTCPRDGGLDQNIYGSPTP
ncbi:sialidase family protein [Edaphobacter aggregans]|uniref:sialidase family protein n=1 Tax=Edaphobacter aggregans TaxID=570835 RepID=UPI0005564BEB|nr:sialidase family protein [Edaphobacter aggregans]